MCIQNKYDQNAYRVEFTPEKILKADHVDQDGANLYVVLNDLKFLVKNHSECSMLYLYTCNRDGGSKLNTLAVHNLSLQESNYIRNDFISLIRDDVSHYQEFDSPSIGFVIDKFDRHFLLNSFKQDRIGIIKTQRRFDEHNGEILEIIHFATNGPRYTKVILKIADATKDEGENMKAIFTTRQWFSGERIVTFMTLLASQMESLNTLTCYLYEDGRLCFHARSKHAQITAYFNPIVDNEDYDEKFSGYD
jgi:hypothetical protein